MNMPCTPLIISFTSFHLNHFFVPQRYEKLINFYPIMFNKKNFKVRTLSTINFLSKNLAKRRKRGYIAENQMLNINWLKCLLSNP